MYICACTNVWVPEKSRGIHQIDPPGAGVSGSYELPDMCARKPNSGPLQHQFTLLTAELCLQAPDIKFKITKV